MLQCLIFIRLDNNYLLNNIEMNNNYKTESQNIDLELVKNSKKG